MFNSMEIIEVERKWQERKSFDFDAYLIYARCRRGTIKLLLKGEKAFIDDTGEWRPLSRKIAEIINLHLAYWRISQAQKTGRAIL